MKQLLMLISLFTAGINAMDDTEKNTKRCCGLFAYFKKCSSKKPERRCILARNKEEYIRMSDDPAFKDDTVIMDFLAHLIKIPHEPVQGTICETLYSRNE